MQNHLHPQMIRLTPDQLSVFKTFKPQRPILHLDIQGTPEALQLLDQLPHRGLAVVGSRSPQRRSVELMNDVFLDLRGSGLIIVSGLARGIDSRAHELALENGLKTIAILGCGIDIEYPRENAHLRKRILEEGGLVISPLEVGTAPVGSCFLYRNQLIAGFSNATWVVEAAAISGTLNTAKWASDYSRDLFATSCFPNDPFFQGNEKLLSQKRTDLYPVAKPFFNITSLGEVWDHLTDQTPRNGNLFHSQSVSEIQQWVLEIKATHGVCHLQALMNHAHSQGCSFGKFYHRYEQELKERKIMSDDQGRVDLIYPA